MNILVTGATGFIGRNLTESLLKDNNHLVLPFCSSNNLELLEQYSASCDFVYHLAAVHRPKNISEFEKVNHHLFASMLSMLRANNNKCPVLLTSSIQATDQTPYGKSKLAAEKALKSHAISNGSRSIIYRLTNTFGRYAKPNSHSVVATFCYNIARGLPIMITDPMRVMKLYYIDDVINSLITHINQSIKPDSDGFYRLPTHLKYAIDLKGLADIIYRFKSDHDQGIATAAKNELHSKLYDTYKSYTGECSKH